MQLLVPSRQYAAPDDVMRDPLDLLAAGGRPDEARVDQQMIDRRAGLRANVALHVEPAGVWPVERLGRLRIRVARRVYALSDRQRDHPVRTPPKRRKIAERFGQAGDVPDECYVGAGRVMPVLMQKPVVIGFE